jgi:HEAT repeat protein
VAETSDDEFDKLTNQLKDEDIWVSSDAAEDLEKYGERAVEALVDAVVKGKNAHVKRSAKFVLTRIGKTALKPMVERLNHDESGVRANAARFLGPFNDEEAIQPLEECLNDNHKAVRFAAEQSIRCIKGESLDQSYLISSFAGPNETEIYQLLREMYEQRKKANQD